MTDFVQSIPDTFVGPSAFNNRGLFTSKDIPEGHVLCHLGGDVVPHNDDLTLLGMTEWNAIDDDLILLRRERTNYFLINHNPAANLSIDPKTFALRARRAIAKGEELSLDYLENGFPQTYLQTERCKYLR